MGKQGPPSIVIVAALAVVKAGLAHIRNHLPHGQQQAQQHNAALVRQLTHEEMSPLHEAVSRIGSLRLAHGQALELPDELLPCCGPDGCGHSSVAAGSDATSSRLSQWLRALALPTALMTSGSAAATATSGAGAGAGASSVSPAESADATAKRCNRRHLHAPSAAALTLSGKLGVELLAMAVAGLAQQWLVLALVALLVLFELAQVVSSGRPSPRRQPQALKQQLQQQQEAEGDALLTSTATAPVAAAAVAAAETVLMPGVDPLLSGVWHKVDSRSDSQDGAADLLKLGGMARTAMRMFKGMEFSVSATHLSSTAITKVPFLKVAKETYALDGSISVYPRRDMRKGNFVGYCKVTPEGGLNLYYKFEEPLAGHSCDEIRLVAPNELHITTHLTVGDGSCAYRVVYYRAGGMGRNSGSGRSSSEAARSSGSSGNNSYGSGVSVSTPTSNPASSGLSGLATVTSGELSGQRGGVGGVGSSGARSRSHSSSGSVASSVTSGKAGAKSSPNAPSTPHTPAGGAALPLPLPAPLLQLLGKAQAAAQAAVKEVSHHSNAGNTCNTCGNSSNSQGQGQCPRSVLAMQPSVSSDEAASSGRDSEDVSATATAAAAMGARRGSGGARSAACGCSPARMPHQACTHPPHADCSNSRGACNTCNSCNSPLGCELGVRIGRVARSVCASPARSSLDVGRRHAHRREDDLGRMSLEADVVRHRPHAGCPFVAAADAAEQCCRSACTSRPRGCHPPSPTPGAAASGGGGRAGGTGGGLPPVPPPVRPGSRRSMDDGRGHSPLNPCSAHGRAAPRPGVSPFAGMSRGDA